MSFPKKAHQINESEIYSPTSALHSTISCGYCLAASSHLRPPSKVIQISVYHAPILRFLSISPFLLYGDHLFFQCSQTSATFSGPLCLNSLSIPNSYAPHSSLAMRVTLTLHPLHACYSHSTSLGCVLLSSYIPCMRVTLTIHPLHARYSHPTSLACVLLSPYIPCMRITLTIRPYTPFSINTHRLTTNLIPTSVLRMTLLTHFFSFALRPSPRC